MRIETRMGQHHLANTRCCRAARHHAEYEVDVSKFSIIPVTNCMSNLRLVVEV